jgi:predicted dehydrogenase
MQQRSGKHYLEAKQEYFDTGKLGKITMARTWWHGNTYHLRRAPASLAQRPSNLDWARYLGPLQWREWDPQQYWNWRAYLDFGADRSRTYSRTGSTWCTCSPGQEIPKSATAAGGVYHYRDGRTAPDTINVLLEYPTDFTATFDATLAPGHHRRGRGDVRHARASVHRPAEVHLHPAGRGAQSTTVNATTDLDVDHVTNFLECVRSRKLPNGDVLIGHRSAQASHLGNIAYMEKRRLAFDTLREKIMPF